jgi:predicted dienelactone hydrolase
MRCAGVGVLCVVLSAAAVRADEAGCLGTSGRADTYCLEAYSAVVERCRRAGDAQCEEDARAEGGLIDRILARSEPRIRAACDDPGSERLGYTSTDDVVKRAGEWCVDFAEDFAALGFAENTAGLDPAARACQRGLSRQLRWLRRAIVRLFGPACALRDVRGGACARARRDTRLALLVEVAQLRIEAACGGTYDGLGLGPLDALLDAVATRARHFAIRVYPPNNLGPSGEFGPYPIGVTTLALSDPSRTNVAGDGPRPVLTEVYYPSTSAAVAGVPRDVVSVFNIPIVATPAYRDVGIAPGPFPLVLFSHANSGIRFQSFFFAAHLASHGYVVGTPDHHGNTFTDLLDRIVDPDVAANRPRDLSFLIDQFLAFNSEAGNRFQGAILPEAIGASGHSFGGFTAFAIAGPGGDPRVKAILPQAPAAVFTDDFLGAIAIPVLIVGGSIDETTEFEPNQQHPFDVLPSGARVVGLAELINAGHFTFSDSCEVDRALLSFLGGFDEACEPRHLPWRHAREIVNYLALNFFDATLRDDADALARLSPAVVSAIDDLRWQSKEP